MKHGIAIPVLLASFSLAACAASPPMQTGGTLPARSVYAAQPDFRGLGPLRFGMDRVQMEKAWTRPLYGHAPAGDPDACYYLRTREDDGTFLLMMEGGRFVRIDVRAPGIGAPDGGGVGSSAADIRKLYAGRISETPDKYDPHASILRAAPRHDEPAWLVFEINAQGAVAAWRIGLPPQVDYVEGCG